MSCTAKPERLKEMFDLIEQLEAEDLPEDAEVLASERVRELIRRELVPPVTWTFYPLGLGHPAELEYQEWMD